MSSPERPGQVWKWMINEAAMNFQIMVQAQYKVLLSLFPAQAGSSKLLQVRVYHVDSVRKSLNIFKFYIKCIFREWKSHNPPSSSIHILYLPFPCTVAGGVQILEATGAKQEITQNTRHQLIKGTDAIHISIVYGQCGKSSMFSDSGGEDGVPRGIPKMTRGELVNSTHVDPHSNPDARGVKQPRILKSPYLTWPVA